MGEKDIIEKQLEDYNEVFADIVNGLLFGGEHVDEVLKLLTVVSGDKRYFDVAKSEKGKVKNMCEVAERLEKRGIEKGIQQGMQKGMQKGIDEKGIQVFLNCISRGMSREDAQAIADISDSLVEKALLHDITKN